MKNSHIWMLVMCVGAAGSSAFARPIGVEEVGPFHNYPGMPSEDMQAAYSLMFIFFMLMLGSLIGYGFGSKGKKQIKRVASLYGYEKPGRTFKIPPMRKLRC